jgi:hypothetical protein
VYVAPAAAAGSQVTLVARGAGGASDSRRVAVVGAATPQPAPEVAAQELPAVGASQSRGVSAAAQTLLAPPQGRRFHFRNSLIVTTRPGTAGVLSVSAYRGAHRLGGCSAPTPAGRTFTCLIGLPASISRQASIGLVATLRTRGRTVTSAQRPAPIAALKDYGSPPACGE